MPRLTPIEPAAATGKAKELFDGPLKTMPINIFKAMAHGPAALQGYLGLSGALAHGLLTPGEREIIQLAVGQANSCDYCLAAHTFLGTKAGLSPEQTIDARRSSLKDPKLAALTTFVLNLHEKRGHISDQDFAAFKAAGYTDGHLPEVVANYALAIFTNYFNHANGTVVDFPAAPRL